MTFTAEEANKKANFYKIKEGSFRLKTTQDDPKAVARPYTNPKTDEKGTAYERVFPALNGIISNIYFNEVILPDGTRLRSLNIRMGEDSQGAEAIATMPEDSRFATDFLSKLPSIVLTEKVRLAPFDFEKNGPRRVGISITQEVDKDYGEPQKVESYFVEKTVVGTETKYKNLHGYPEATDEDKQDWPFYYKKVNKFLVQFAKINILPKFQEDSTRSTTEESDQPEENGALDADDIKDSIPF